MNPTKQIWQAVLGNLELSLSKANFTTWFKNTSVLDQSGEKIVIGVPNTFTKEWLQNKYHQDILRALRTINPGIKQVEYRITSGFAPRSPEPVKVSAGETRDQGPTETQTIKTGAVQSGLNPKYTFQNFIVGSNNELASAS